MGKCRLAALLFVAFVAGMLYQTWAMVRMDIDEYHTARMEIEDRLRELGVGDGESDG